MFVTKSELINDQDQNQADQEEGEFFKDDIIPFSLEYYLNIVENTFFGKGNKEDDEESN